MARKVNWRRAAIILGGAAALIAALIALGRIPSTVFLPTAHAGEAELTWTAPTKRCDGTPLTNLAGYSLTYGQARVDLPTAPLGYTVTGLAPGTWWLSLAAVDDKGERSEFVTVSKVVEPAEFVTVGGPVLTLVKKLNGLLLLPVGTVPAGVQCIAGATVNGHYVVPRSAVSWSGSVRPDVVVTLCK